MQIKNPQQGMFCCGFLINSNRKGYYFFIKYINYTFP